MLIDIADLITLPHVPPLLFFPTYLFTSTTYLIFLYHLYCTTTCLVVICVACMELLAGFSQERTDEWKVDRTDMFCLSVSLLRDFFSPSHG